MKNEKLMKKCLRLAIKGVGEVSPNPLVGCVVLDKDNKIISQAYHKKFGDWHAERNALLNLDNNKTKGGTLIVNLEPCCHYGKTPPCTDIIIEKGIKKVIIGMRDVNPLVSGNGIKILKNAGIEVIEGVLKDDCKKLNEIFIKNMNENKVFVAIKTATTVDGKIATYNGSSKWITSIKSRNKVKEIRKRYDAILTSSSTVITDNPKMLHKNKIIIDRNLKTDFKNSEIYKTGKIYIFYDKEISKKKLAAAVSDTAETNIELIPASANSGKINIEEILSIMYKRGIMSILVEAGGHLNGSFINYADKLYQFIAPKIVCDNNGLSCFDGKTVNDISDSVNLKITSVEHFEPDILITYDVVKSACNFC